MASRVESRRELVETLQEEGGHSTPGHSVAGCLRCGGLLVREFCTDLLSSTGELDFVSCRCVQCGEVVDPVILQNRRRQQEIGNGRTVPGSVRAIECQVTALF